MSSSVQLVAGTAGNARLCKANTPTIAVSAPTGSLSHACHHDRLYGLRVPPVRETDRIPDKKAPRQPSRATARNAAAPTGSGVSLHFATLPLTATVVVGVRLH